MFEITIKGDTLEALSSNLLTMAEQLGANRVWEPKAEPQEAKPAAKAKPKKAEAFVPDAADDETPDPLPDSAKGVVDAGTGQPVAAEEEPVKQMTMDDVRSSAAKLAAADSPKLAEILKSYGAGKLSEVPSDKLADFAGDVIEALG